MGQSLALSLPLARLVEACGHVLAFEPQRAIHGLLVTNLILKGQEHARAEAGERSCR